MTGFEPALPAWRAGVLPLNYTRIEGGGRRYCTLRQQESNLSAHGLEPLCTPPRDRPAWTPLCRTAGQRNRRSPQTSDLSSADLSLSSRLTRTGGTSAGAMRGIGCSPRDAVIRPVNPLCTVSPLYAARPSVSAYRYSRVATPCRSAGIEPAFPDFTRRTPYVPSAAYTIRFE